MADKDPKANTLYRYIKEWKWFRKALEAGVFIPRFCDEDFAWMANGKPCCLLLPMVCFCDIPLSHSRMHRSLYGHYAIGLSKSWGKKNGLNPVMYVSENSDLANTLGNRFGRAITKPKPSPNDFGEFWPMLPYLKPVDGFQKDGLASLYKDFEQEMEWRFVPNTWEDLVESRQLDERSDADKADQNAPVSHIQLKFDESDIEIIIVNTPLQRKHLSQLRPSSRGKIKLWQEIPR